MPEIARKAPERRARPAPESGNASLLRLSMEEALWPRIGPLFPTLTIEGIPMLPTVLLVVLLLLLIGALPTWPHSQTWGYYPSGGLGILAVVLILFFLL